jgi:hypothetical protein
MLRSVEHGWFREHGVHKVLECAWSPAQAHGPIARNWKVPPGHYAKLESSDERAKCSLFYVTFTHAHLVAIVSRKPGLPVASTDAADTDSL